MRPSRISPEFLQKIKDAVNLIDVVGEHVVLRKSGSNYTGLCPFHNERSPSFSVSEQKQLYHCYGCKKGGDLISFTQEIHGLSFAEAVEELAERGQVPLPKDFKGSGDESDPEVAKKKQAARDRLQTAYKLNRFAAKFFRDQLTPNAHIAQYFKKRGVSDEIAQSFYLGASPPSWDALARFFVQAKAPLKLAEELGLVKPSQKGQSPGGPGYFDLFRNRAMFPILDLRGKVVGFGGRGLPLPPGAPDVGGESPKYLNSSDSLLFHKSKIAYGLYQAQKFIREKDEVILVEGYFDVLALHGAGFRNAVATCGTALTVDHLNVFKKFCSKITVLFDGDRAGIQATDRAMEIGLAEGLILFGAAMPPDLDPDEVLFDQSTGKILPGGVEQMTAILQGSKPLLDARMDAAIVYAKKGSEEKTQALKQVAEWLGIYNDPVGREVRIDAAARGFEVTRALLDRAPPKRGDRSTSARVEQNAPSAVSPVKFLSQSPPKNATKHQKISPREAILVKGLLKGGTLRAMLEEALHYLPREKTLASAFENEEAGRLVEAIVLRKESPEDWLSRLEDPRLREVVSASLVESDEKRASPDSAFYEADYRIAVQRSLSFAWARFSHELIERLRIAELNKDADLHSQLLQEYLDVQRRMKEFGTFYDES